MADLKKKMATAAPTNRPQVLQTDDDAEADGHQPTWGKAAQRRAAKAKAKAAAAAAAASKTPP